MGSRGALVCAAAAALAGLVYLNALHNPFFYDDHRMVVDNASIQRPLNLRAILLHEVTRPAVNLSYAIDRVVWGAQPFGFHVTNVLLHMLNVILLFLLAWRVVDDRRLRADPRTASPVRPEVAAFATAVLFAVHPLMTEAVGYISGRSEVLCATFFLLALLSARRWMVGDGGRWWFLTVGLWAAALATKEIAAMFPFVLLAYDRLVLGGTQAERRRRVLKLHVPLVASALLAGGLRLAVFAWVEHPGKAVVHWRYILVEMDVIRRYFVLFLVPGRQTIFHVVSSIGGVFDPRALVAMGALGLSIAIAWRARRVAHASFGIFWFLLLVIPSSTLVVLDLGEPMAEHRVYLASCGLFLAAGAAIAWLAARLTHATGPARLVARPLFVLGVLALCGATIVRNAVWADPVALWLESAEKAPDHWLPHLMLGEALHAAGRRDKAVGEYKTALLLRPQEQVGYEKLGLCLAEMGRLDEASAAFEKLRHLNPRSAVASTGLGAVAMLAGQPDRARRYFLETIADDPRNVSARQSLAILEERITASPAEALRLCEEIQRLAPETPGNDECIRRNRSRLAANGSGGH